MPDQEKKTPESKASVPSDDVVSVYDSFAPEYDAWFDEEGKLIFESELKALEEILPALPRPWLEVGIGSGRFALALGIETGIDPSVGMGEISRSRGLKVLQAKGEKLPFNDGSFGTVFLVFTLCFVDSIKDVLQEAYRILKPEGKIVVGEVLMESPLGRHYKQEAERGHRVYKYSNFCRYEDLTTSLEKTGFATERVISTLFQERKKIDNVELPREGYSSDASFTVILAGKMPESQDNGKE